MKSSSQQVWSVLVLAFGAFATFVGVFGALGSFIGFAASSGCDRIVTQLCGFAAAILLLIGIPHVLVGLMGLMRQPGSANALRALGAVNLLINVGTIAFVAMQVGPLFATPWVGLAFVNVALLFTLRADPVAQPR
ncbi:MAG: hypothetical protein JNJ88_14335 [Planctomycetes bacterium]|nr:hypothetical protein [Planctomycetota bacterium]